MMGVGAKRALGLYRSLLCSAKSRSSGTRSSFLRTTGLLSTAVRPCSAAAALFGENAPLGNRDSRRKPKMSVSGGRKLHTYGGRKLHTRPTVEGAEGVSGAS